MTDKSGIKRRYHSIGFKRKVVAATQEAGASVAGVAQRFGVNANLVFKWRRDVRFNGGGKFLSVEVIEDQAPSCDKPVVAETVTPEISHVVEVSLASNRCLHLPLCLDDATARRLIRLVEGA